MVGTDAHKGEALVRAREHITSSVSELKALVRKMTEEVTNSKSQCTRYEASLGEHRSVKKAFEEALVIMAQYCIYLKMCIYNSSPFNRRHTRLMGSKIKTAQILLRPHFWKERGL